MHAGTAVAHMHLHVSCLQVASKFPWNCPPNERKLRKRGMSLGPSDKSNGPIASMLAGDEETIMCRFAMIDLKPWSHCLKRCQPALQLSIRPCIDHALCRRRPSKVEPAGLSKDNPLSTRGLQAGENEGNLHGSDGPRSSTSGRSSASSRRRDRELRQQGRW